jgi:hypothetical protein
MTQSDSVDPAPLDRARWTKPQRHLFEEALSGERLMDIVNTWTAPTEDATNVAPKILHVPPLTTAAASMIQSGIVELVRCEQPDPPIETQAALAIVRDVQNWWPPDADDDGPTEEISPHPSVVLCLFSTPFGESLDLS